MNMMNRLLGELRPFARLVLWGRGSCVSGLKRMPSLGSTDPAGSNCMQSQLALPRLHGEKEALELNLTLSKAPGVVSLEALMRGKSSAADTALQAP